MGVPQVLQGISIVFLSLRKSLQDWQTRSGGRISRRRFFLLRLRLPPVRSPPARSPPALAAAIAGASALIDDVSATAGGEASAACSTAAFSPSFSPFWAAMA